MNARHWILSAWTAAALVAATTPAAAQYGAQPASDPATGEVYRVELSGLFWQPAPDIQIASEGLGIPPTLIDFQDDLGVESEWLYEVRLILRPGRRHKFHFDYTPIKYTASTVLDRPLVFNGILFNAGQLVETDFDWKVFNLLYEYDFLYRDRWFVGFLIGAKYNDISATLTSSTATEFTKAKGPIPAVGGIARVYFAPNISLTGSVSLFDMPDEIAEDWNGDMYDIDVYGTINFTNNFGVIAGFRSFEIDYRVDLDAGRVDMAGWYVGGAVRF